MFTMLFELWKTSLNEYLANSYHWSEYSGSISQFFKLRREMKISLTFGLSYREFQKIDCSRNQDSIAAYKEVAVRWPTSGLYP